MCYVSRLFVQPEAVTVLLKLIEEDNFLCWERGNMRRQTGLYFFCKEIGKEMARQRNGREGTAARGLGWCLRTQGVVVVCLAVNHPHSDFLCCLWAQCPSATCGCPFLFCVTVWELCCAGGSPRSAPGRPRGRQLVYYGPHRGTQCDTGRRACAWKSVWVNICSAGGLFKSQQQRGI